MNGHHTGFTLQGRQYSSRSVNVSRPLGCMTDQLKTMARDMVEAYVVAGFDTIPAFVASCRGLQALEKFP